ncbi:flavin-containing monooxygenase [Sedimentitalea nanhaiensis]|uniref:Cyclohexanone monooxygenase/acetone monooxygenase n=1 Tax=Sedimentitalea nanhaiensis TaxID=999627 RepID=A0A1I7E9H9_9RHOB|nr:NAD(P)/FAD-dependent oxidoreductase [Sedimentitalea nanhaiensis]SFU20535.1 cyclohexanone monooxygenase/acetone monooxygenase [Sedimentitalea nanhaiensis]
MLDSTQTAVSAGRKTVPAQLDALVIGAGVAGLYQLHQLRELGLKVHGCDAAGDVGGTWYWNRYPGAKFDSEAYIYQYLFDEGLYKGWTWSERFPAQPEIERWLHYVTDSLNLRDSLSFSTTVTNATFNEDTGRWTVETDQRDVIDTQYLVCCTGMLSAPLQDRFPGQASFEGDIVHTARYPREGLDMAGKRVGVIGTGATGIQVIQTIAPEVDRLTVFVRTPQYVLPMKNPKYGPEEAAWYKGRFEELRSNLPHHFAGFEYDFENTWADLTPAQRHAVLEEMHADGSLKLWLASFAEIFFDEAVSEEVSEFVREKMRARLKDPALIDILVPKSGDYGFGTHRVPLESNYLEAYLRDNVQAVSVRDNPIAEIVPQGVKLADGTVHELDVIIMAVGFDAGSGALTRINITGRNGMTIRDEWAKDIRTTMGLMKYGFPNFFMTGAPLAPSAALCNMTTCLQQQTEWIAGCIGYMRDSGQDMIEPTLETEDAWVAHHDETASANLISKTDSWYNGANIEGKPRRVLSYTGGVGTYRAKCEEIARSGYASFAQTRVKAPQSA